MSAAIEESGAAASGQGPPLPSAVEPGVAPGDGEGADERSDSPAAEPGKRRKRKLALHLAYTGTAFSGAARPGLRPHSLARGGYQECGRASTCRAAAGADRRGA